MESSPHLYPPSEASGEQSPLPAPRRFTGARAATLAAAAAAAAAPVSESREMIEVAKSSNSSTASVPRRFVRQQVPDSILHDPKLAAAISLQLPSNYDFEVHKTIWRLRTLRPRRVALQFPEGLLLFSLTLADIVQEFVPEIETVTVLGDVAYGACCVDDQGALASAGAEVLIHYGHSCLVPVQRAAIPTIYVFVHISCDVDHLISTIELNFYKTDREGENGTRTTGNGDAEGDEKDDRTKKRRKPIAIAGTVQFAPAVAAASAAFATNAFRPRPVVPQSRPLSPGEVLGCTAPRLEMEEEEEEEEEEEVEEEVDEGEGRATSTSTSKKKNPKPAGKEENRESSSSSVEALVFVADGRFHMEALMIANPTVPAFRYDPYSRVLTREEFDHRGMRRARKEAISLASREERWGIVLGTLGRQGSREVLAKLVAAAQGARKEVSVVLVSELSPAKLAALTKEKEGSRRGRRKKSGGIGGLDEKNPENGDKKDDDFPFFAPPRAWAQVACPRLSIDWGEGFGGLPVLTPYEAMVALGVEEGWWVGKKEEEKKKENSSPSSAGCCGGGESGCGGKSSEKEYSPVVDLEGDPDRGHYPMDYYSSTGGAWAGTYHRASAAAAERARAAAAARARRKATSGGGGVVRRAAAAAAAVS